MTYVFAALAYIGLSYLLYLISSLLDYALESLKRKAQAGKATAGDSFLYSVLYIIVTLLVVASFCLIVPMIIRGIQDRFESSEIKAALKAERQKQAGSDRLA